MLCIRLERVSSMWEDQRQELYLKNVIQVRDIDTKVGLRMDVSTRWNFTYLMLGSAIRYRRSFGCLTIRDKNYVHCPSNDEWKRAGKMWVLEAILCYH